MANNFLPNIQYHLLNTHTHTPIYTHNIQHINTIINPLQSTDFLLPQTPSPLPTLFHYIYIYIRWFLHAMKRVPLPQLLSSSPNKTPTLFHMPPSHHNNSNNNYYYNRTCSPLPKPQLLKIAQSKVLYFKLAGVSVGIVVVVVGVACVARPPIYSIHTHTH